MRRMRVALLTRSLRWGIGHHTSTLAMALQRMGIEVDVIKPSRESIIDVSLYPLFKNGRFRRADVLHVQGSTFGTLSRIGKPVVTTVHTTTRSEFAFERQPLFLLAGLLERMTLRNSDAVIAVNPDLLAELLPVLGDTPIFPIPNSIDCSLFPEPKSTPVETVVTGGRLIYRKDFPTFLKAMARLQYRTGVNAVIFGEGRMRQYLHSLAGKLGLRNVRFAGYVSRSELLDLYSSSAIFVSTSRYETGPITLLEAMASQLPVISSDIAAVSGLVRDGKTGLLFQPGDHLQLAASIELLLDDSALARRLSFAAKDFVRKNFNPLEVAKQTAIVYETVLS